MHQRIGLAQIVMQGKKRAVVNLVGVDMGDRFKADETGIAVKNGVVVESHGYIS